MARVAKNPRVVRSTSLAARAPALVKQLHPDNDLDPSTVGIGSNRKVKWRCPQGHVWETTIENRARFGSPCPYCSGLRPTAQTCLAATHPHLVAEWHPDNELKPTEVIPGSVKKVKWLCPKGHVYIAAICRRTTVQQRHHRPSGCPYCVNKAVDDTNSVAALRPDLVAEWHPSNKIKPSEITIGSNKPVAWICSKGHVWRTMISMRTKKGHGCPFCSHLYAPPEDSLAITHPHLLAEWHPDNRLRMTEVTAGSKKPILWVCPKGHCYQLSVIGRCKAKFGCPDCDRYERILRFIAINHGEQEAALARQEGRILVPNPRRVRSQKPSFAASYPAIAAEWHPDNELKPTDVSRRSGKKVRWQCPNNPEHVWVASISNRAGGSGCPHCIRPGSAGNVDPARSLAVTHPHLIPEWHHSNSLAMTDVTSGSGYRAVWQCSNGHVWDERVATRMRTGCPFCSRHRVDDTNCLTVTHPELLPYWHPQNTLQPSEVHSGSKVKVFWLCQNGIEAHVYSTKVYRRVSGQGCPYCIGRAVNQTNCLATVRPDLAAEWHPSNTLKPTDVTSGSARKVKWVCGAGHVWEATISNRSRMHHGCPYCKRRKVSPENCLAATHPHLVPEWHPSNRLKPTQVMLGSNVLVRWLCPNNHVYERSVSYRTTGSNCPICAMQVKTRRLLDRHYGDWEGVIQREEQRQMPADE